MSYGRKDYFWGVAPEKSVFGENQTPWFETDSIAVTKRTNTYLIDYDVSAGYILQVTGFSINTTIPGLMYCRLYDNDDIIAVYYWDTFVNILFGEGGNLTIDPSHQFRVRVYNLDYDLDAPIYVTCYGFLQQTIV